MNNEEFIEIEKTLKKIPLIDSTDYLELVEKGDYWEKFLFINSQVRGYYYFTSKAICFIGGFAGSTKWSIKYECIKSIKKCNVGLFLPYGIKIEAYDENKNKLVKYKLSLLKRNKWIEYIENKIKN